LLIFLSSINPSVSIIPAYLVDNDEFPENHGSSVHLKYDGIFQIAEYNNRLAIVYQSFDI